MRRYLLPSIFLLLAGCNNSPPYYLQTVDLSKNSVSMDAKQRLILVGQRDGHSVVCAEPSPDALSSFASALAANANVSAKGAVPGLGGIADPTVGGGLASASAEQAAYIGARNATIQMLRDGLYRACEAYLNNTIDGFGYGLILANYGRLMGGLLMVEGLTRPQPVPPVIVSAAASTSGDDKRNAAGATGTPPAITVNAGGAPDATAVTALGNALAQVALPLFDPSRGGARTGQSAMAVDLHSLATACLLRQPSDRNQQRDALCGTVATLMLQPAGASRP